MKRGFFLTESESGGSAAQPVSPVLSSAEQPGSSGNTAGGSAAQSVSPVLSSAEQPGSSGNTAQPVSNRSQVSTIFNSVVQVDSWLRANVPAVASSVEAMRVKEVVDVLKRPREEDVQPFFSVWGVKQKINKKPKPLRECIQELSTKVVEAAGRLQTDIPSVASSAERPGTSSAEPLFDIRVESQLMLALYDQCFLHHIPGSQCGTKSKAQPVHRRAYGFLQDCRKYQDCNLSLDELDEQKMKNIIRELEIESQPHCSSQMCRELYKLTKIAKVPGMEAFRPKNSQGYQEELDHDEVRYTAYCLTQKDLAKFLSGREALPAEMYPFLAELESLGVKVQRKSRQETYDEGLLEILKYMPATEDLPFLPDYGENEWLYRIIAEHRDFTAGIRSRHSQPRPHAWELWVDELEKMQQEMELLDWRTQDERDEEEYLDDLTIKKMEFREECKTIMASQGESKEECYLRFVRMWPQVRDEWHAKRKAAGKFVPN